MIHTRHILFGLSLLLCCVSCSDFASRDSRERTTLIFRDGSAMMGEIIETTDTSVKFAPYLDGEGPRDIHWTHIMKLDLKNDGSLALSTVLGFFGGSLLGFGVGVTAARDGWDGISDILIGTLAGSVLGTVGGATAAMQPKTIKVEKVEDLRRVDRYALRPRFP